MKNIFSKIKSERNQEKLIHEHFEYTLSYQNETNEVWRCVDRKCKGKANILKIEQTICVFSEHNHHPQIFKVKKILFRQDIIDYATNTTYTSSRIYDLVSADLSKIDSLLINKQNTLKLVNNVRKRLDKLDADASSSIPSYLLRTQRNDDFLLFKSDEKNYEMMIFTTQKNLIYLKTALFWIGDGTFRSCPKEYSQLYVLFAPVMGKVVPLVYVLLNGKSTTHYNKMFDALMPHLIGDQLKYLVVDNEKALQKSFSSYFPEAKIFLCFFHFSQCIYRNVQKCGLIGEYLTKKSLYDGVSMLRALIFVPQEKICSEFEKIEDFFNLKVKKNLKNLERFISYFKRTHLTSTKGILEGLSAIERIKNDIPLTTNIAESFNRTLNSKFNVDHPNICAFLRVLRTFQHETEKNILVSLLSPDTDYSDIYDSGLKKEKLIKIIDNYDKYVSHDYLEAILTINAEFVEITEENVDLSSDFEE